MIKIFNKILINKILDKIQTKIFKIKMKKFHKIQKINLLIILKILIKIKCKCGWKDKIGKLLKIKIKIKIKAQNKFKNLS
jgi:hypothetical protein